MERRLGPPTGKIIATGPRLHVVTTPVGPLVGDYGNAAAGDATAQEIAAAAARQGELAADVASSGWESAELGA
jgi:hypothetical protein